MRRLCFTGHTAAYGCKTKSAVAGTSTMQRLSRHLHHRGLRQHAAAVAVGPPPPVQAAPKPVARPACPPGKTMTPSACK